MMARTFTQGRGRAILVAICLLNLTTAALVWSTVSNALATRSHRDDLDLISNRLVELGPLRQRSAVLKQQHGTNAMAAPTLAEAKALIQSRLRRAVQEAGGSLLTLAEEPSAVANNSGMPPITATLRLRLGADRTFQFTQILEGLPSSEIVKAALIPLRDSAGTVEMRVTVATRVKVAP